MNARRFLLRLPDPLPEPIEDLVVAALWGAGTLGLEIRPAKNGEPGEIVAFFPTDTNPEQIDVVLDGAELGEHRPRIVGCDEQRDEDWMAAWREQAKPFAVGERFLLDPREPDDPQVTDPRGPETGDRLWLRLPARRAFGTGSHETTRLVLELLEAHPPVGRTVLDVGTGTGVLSFAARALGARSAVGFDIDPVAVAQARVNHPLNAHLGDVEVRLFTGTAAALAPEATFDVVLVNVLPERIEKDLPAVLGHVAEGGALVLSGLLVEQEEAALEAVGRGGDFVVRAKKAAGEWLGLYFVSASGSR